MLRQKGFTLLEVLVAFTVLALVMGAMFQVFGDGLRAAGRAAEYSRAVLVAESRLAAVGTEQPLAAGEEAGETDDGLRWRVAVTPYDPGEELDMRTVAVDVWRIAVEVAWGQGREAGSVGLSTLRLAVRQ